MFPGKLTAALMMTALFLAAVTAAELQPGEAYREIMQKKTLRAGISLDYPPLNFNAGEKSVEIEMARELGEFMGAQDNMSRNYYGNLTEVHYNDLLHDFDIHASRSMIVEVMPGMKISYD